MSQAKIAVSVSDLVSFIKDKTILNIVESKNKGELDLDQVSLENIAKIIDLSSKQGLSLGFTNVESAIQNFIDNKTG